MQYSQPLELIFCPRHCCIKIVLFACSFGTQQGKSNRSEVDCYDRRFQSLIPSYIRDSSVAVIVYDISSRSSFENVTKWVKDVRDQRDEVILVIVGNKTDLSDSRCEMSILFEYRTVTIEEGQKLALENNALFFESSAKCNYNIDTVFKKVVEKLPGDGRQVELEESQKCNYCCMTNDAFRYSSEHRACKRTLQKRLVLLLLIFLFQQTRMIDMANFIKK